MGFNPRFGLCLIARDCLQSQTGPQTVRTEGFKLSRFRPASGFQTRSTFTANSRRDGGRSCAGERGRSGAEQVGDGREPYGDEDSLAVICKDIIQKWSETTNSISQEKNVEDEVHAIASMIEKQAQIVVKQKDTSEEEKSRKAAVLAQYANITDEEDEDEESHGTSGAFNFEDKSLFKNTNVESVLVAKKAEREKAREDAQKKKEQDKLQREKDKLAKQERKEKEKKRTQKGERKR
ncbi:hypothetical protein chiPu_0012690 [Chiloscyllium punctatum]|uniref:Uncharacterized protein n=1 Tax=Chiloscyllium punctatum TaxID=137246 RepID=A0A401SUY1_CHIPU|nr:hypothetical protein [Chiloscyllium punctatum]